jgi:hypothetical protein
VRLSVICYSFLFSINGSPLDRFCHPYPYLRFCDSYLPLRLVESPALYVRVAFCLLIAFLLDVRGWSCESGGASGRLKVLPLAGVTDYFKGSALTNRVSELFWTYSLGLPSRRQCRRLLLLLRPRAEPVASRCHRGILARSILEASKDPTRISTRKIARALL